MKLKTETVILLEFLVQCWLKKQKDPLAPDRQEAGENTIWTSGLLFGKGEDFLLFSQHKELKLTLKLKSRELLAAGSCD
ncbi:hypothetical protein L2E82_10951 [Cichorium intybus]|uniref:Uncharacterized protein n=1 Tax=Cichorium intybus TaxID=13427 RepID=A0ACB9GD75_CICIN|nr:hypothetical protein L2E82_10951 [Cichorium intybus]